MPLFEYRCEACGGEFEALVGPGETPRCPQCGGDRLKKLLSTFAASSSKRTPAGTCGGCDFGGDCSASHSHGAGCGCGGCAGHHH